MTKQHLANIMPGLACGSQQCEFVSMEGTPEQKLQHLSLHTQATHPQQQQHPLWAGNPMYTASSSTLLMCMQTSICGLDSGPLLA